MGLWDNPGFVGNVVNAGSNILGNVMNWLSGNDANSQNRELMREQNEWALKMWNLNNEYNHPSAQMARLRAAGINPALAYSNGADNVASAVSETADAPTMRPGQWQPFQVDASAISQAEVSRAQADLFRAQAADLLGETEESKMRIFKLGSEASKLAADADLSRQKIQESIKVSESMDADIRLKDAQAASVKFNDELHAKEVDQKVMESRALVNLYIEQAFKTHHEGLKAKYDAEITEEAFGALVNSLIYQMKGLEYDLKLKDKSVEAAILDIKQKCWDYVSGQKTYELTLLELERTMRREGFANSSIITRGLDGLLGLLSGLISVRL